MVAENDVVIEVREAIKYALDLNSSAFNLMN